MILDIKQRLDLLYEWVNNSQKFNNATECLGALNAKIDEIEDLYSGVFKVENPSYEPDGRMYPIQNDNVIKKENGSLTCRAKNHILYITFSGSVAIVNKDKKMVECIKQ